MSLRHSILGLLMLSPANGYELNRRFDDTLRNAWHASHSQIYPELAKLEQAGLIEVVDEGPRGSKTYGVTDAGRAEVQRWLVDEDPERSQRNVTAVRWFLACLLPDEERHAYFAAEADHLAGIDAYMREQRALMDEQGKTGGFRPVLELGLEMQEVMLRWLREQAS